MSYPAELLDLLTCVEKLSTAYYNDSSDNTQDAMSSAYAALGRNRAALERDPVLKQVLDLADNFVNVVDDIIG